MLQVNNFKNSPILQYLKTIAEGDIWFVFRFLCFQFLFEMWNSMQFIFRENGCLQVIPRSHKLGRLNHSRAGTMKFDFYKFHRKKNVFSQWFLVIYDLEGAGRKCPPSGCIRVPWTGRVNYLTLSIVSDKISSKLEYYLFKTRPKVY